MKRLLLLVAVLVALVATPLNALAATYIQDNANMFSANAKNQAMQAIDGIVKRTSKEVLVYTVPSLNGQDPVAAANNVFRQQQTNGVLIFASRDDRRLEVVVGQDTRQAIPASKSAQIRQTMLNDFRANNQQGFDKGLVDGVNAVNAALPSVRGGANGRTAPATQSGPNWLFIGMLILIGLLVVWVIMGIRRARQQQQPYFSYGQQAPGAPGYGQPGYGGGPGFGGGGGFFSGLMGGIGGALLGNALFNAFRPHDSFDNQGGFGGGDQGSRDQGWQGDDAGQVGDTTGGSWGDSGGGGGDVGFGGGGDSGGGGGGGDW